MYCSSCGVAVAQGLSYCNYCGAKLSGTRDKAAAKSSGNRPDFLVSAMVGFFIFGLLAIAVLMGVMKRVVGFDLSIILAITWFSFALMLALEGLLIWLLLSGKRSAKEAGDEGQLKEQTTQELGEAQPRALPEPAPSVTEHTTRAFEPLYSERKSK
jgi:hypothetical protein